MPSLRRSAHASAAVTPEFSDHLKNIAFWRIDGHHYAKTCEDWLRNRDAHENTIRPLFRTCYGADRKTIWIVR